MEGSVKAILSDKDLDFVIETVAPKVIDKPKLKQIILEDEGFRNSFIGDEKIFKRVMEEENLFLKISPTLFFQILLRRTVIDLEKVSYTFEKTSTAKIPIFDTKEVIDLLSKESILLYPLLLRFRHIPFQFHLEREYGRKFTLMIWIFQP